MDAIIRNCYENALKILSEHKATLTELAQALIIRETLDFDELETLFKGEKLPAKTNGTSSPEINPPQAKIPAPAAFASPG